MKNIFLFVLLLLCQLQFTFGQNIQKDFYFKYSEIGLGSNRGLSLPCIEIQNNILVYSLKQTSSSYFGDTSKTDTLLIKNFKKSSIDSIKKIAEPFLDSTILEYNFCLMSGSVHKIKLSYGSDSTIFYLQNTFHRKILPIMTIINSYIPKNLQLLFSEEYIRKREECNKRKFNTEGTNE